MEHQQHKRRLWGSLCSLTARCLWIPAGTAQPLAVLLHLCAVTLCLETVLSVLMRSSPGRSLTQRCAGYLSVLFKSVTCLLLGTD